MIAKNSDFRTVIEELKNKPHDFTRDGKCVQCGACCGNFLPISKKEIARIHRYIREHYIKEYTHLFPVSSTNYDFTCPFMDDSKLKEKCRIYPVRPEICRQFCCKKDNPEFRFKENPIEYSPINVRKEFFG